LIHIDKPEAHSVSRDVFELVGWYALDREPMSLQIRMGGREISCRRIPRPDVERSHPRKWCAGFGTLLTLSNHVDAIHDGVIELALVVDAQPVDTLALAVPDCTRDEAVAARSARRHKRDWLSSRLCCPSCKRGPLDIQSAAIACPACGLRCEQRHGAMDLITSQMAASHNIVATENVSAHPYDPIALSVIEGARAGGGMVLDCGAGLRDAINPYVIASEIVDYPTTDVLAVNHSLPFVDESFDGILSLNVLEHVTDPFQCAAELARVLKPGGTLYCVVPMLQPEHGYPDHYYNMTRSGLSRLFHGKLEVKEQFVPLSGHPIFSLHWMASWYLEHLPPKARKRLQSMTFAELLQRTPVQWLSDAVTSQLSTDGQWRLASTTALLLTKSAMPASQDRGVGRLTQ